MKVAQSHRQPVMMLRHRYRPSELLEEKVLQFVDEPSRAAMPRLFLLSTRTVSLDIFQSRAAVLDESLEEIKQEFQNGLPNHQVRSRAIEFSTVGYRENATLRSLQLGFLMADQALFSNITQRLVDLGDPPKLPYERRDHYLTVALPIEKLVEHDALQEAWQALKDAIEDTEKSGHYYAAPEDIVTRYLS